jgi:hypothetical protein
MSRVGNFEIHKVDEHWEIRLEGKFICSADTIDEAYREIDKEEGK